MKGSTAHSSSVPRRRGPAHAPSSRLVRLTSSVCVRIAAATAGLVAMPVTTICAADIPWRSSYAEAWREAGREGKPMLVQVTAEWCAYCHKMQGETYADGSIQEQVRDGFVAVMLDADANPELVEALKVDALPATVIVTVDRKIMRRLSGYQTTEQLSSALSAVPTEGPVATRPRPPAHPAPAVAERPDGDLVANLSP
jgi:thiol:disulfide interchange protein